jgi:hypothetical protein
MKLSEIVFESKDIKSFKSDIKDLLMKDQKAKQLFQQYRKDEDKMVDFIDYVMSKYSKQIESSMKDNNINYDESVDLLLKVL